MPPTCIELLDQLGIAAGDFRRDVARRARDNDRRRNGAAADRRGDPQRCRPGLDPVGIERIQTYVGKDARFASWDEAAEAIAVSNHGAPSSYNHDDWVAMARRNCREDNGEIRFDYDMAIRMPFEARPTPKIDMWPLFRALGEKPLLVVRGEISDLLSADALARMHDAVPGHEVGDRPTSATRRCSTSWRRRRRSTTSCRRSLA